MPYISMYSASCLLLVKHKHAAAAHGRRSRRGVIYLHSRSDTRASEARRVYAAPVNNLYMSPFDVVNFDFVSEQCAIFNIYFYLVFCGSVK